MAKIFLEASVRHTAFHVYLVGAGHLCSPLEEVVMRVKEGKKN